MRVATVLFLAILLPQANPADPDRREAARAELEQLYKEVAVQERASALVHELVSASVVSIHTRESLLRRSYWGVVRQEVSAGEGSGFVFSATKGRRYVLTNAHVVLQTNDRQEFVKDERERPVWHERVLVRANDGRVLEAAPVGADTQTDLAVVMIDNEEQVKPTDLPPVVWGDSDRTQVGTRVVALGYPLGVGYSATFGHISATSKFTGIYQSEEGYESFLQTDAAINPGNSGGPLVNMRGEVVGVNANIVSRSGGNVGLGFAIPSLLARRIAEDLMDDGLVTRPRLGVNLSVLKPEEIDNRKVPNRSSVLINFVFPGSPAHKAGLRENDVVLGVGGIEIKDVPQFRARVVLARIGQALPMSVWRDGKTLEVSLTPVTDEILEHDITSALESAPGQGVLLKRFGMRLGTDEFNGVIIREIVARGPAAQARLKPGDRILRFRGLGSVGSLADLAPLEREDELILDVYQSGRIRTVTLQAK